jgi:hypothetical protein
MAWAVALVNNPVATVVVIRPAIHAVRMRLAGKSSPM